jgi:hypothetical protein
VVKAVKRLKKIEESYDRDAVHDPAAALELVKANATARFDETIEVSFKLGIDPRKSDQMVRGTVSLPEGTGKEMRVAVFAEGHEHTPVFGVLFDDFKAKEVGVEGFRAEKGQHDLLGRIKPTPLLPHPVHDSPLGCIPSRNGCYHCKCISSLVSGFVVGSGTSSRGVVVEKSPTPRLKLSGLTRNAERSPTSPRRYR